MIGFGRSLIVTSGGWPGGDIGRVAGVAGNAVNPFCCSEESLDATAVCDETLVTTLKYHHTSSPKGIGPCRIKTIELPVHV